MWILIIASALVFAAIYSNLFADLRYVPAMALFGIPVAIAALCIGMAVDAGVILRTIGVSYGVFLVVIALWMTAARALRARRPG
jgi:hypothetical protein